MFKIRFGVAFMLVFACVGFGHAQERIVVAGEGTVSVVPDMATLQFGVVEEAGRAERAIAGALRKADSMLASLEDAGLAPEDVQTGSLDLQPRYSRASTNNAAQIEGYRARYTVTVQVLDLNELGLILDAALTAGSNQLDRLQLAVQDEAAARAEAEELAVQDAMARANRIASAAGVELGDVARISVDMQSAPVPVMARMEMATSSMPIALGQHDITAHVVMEFDIGE